MKCILFLTLACSLSAIPSAAQSFPKSTGRINDFADVIDAATEAELDRQIDLLEQHTSSEVAVATVKSLDGISVEEYANRLFKEWGIGQAKADNGVLVLVAPNERKMRIEVGYGLEGVLPDGLAGQVIRDDFTPRFKDGDYSGGIRDGVVHLVQIVEKHEVLTPEQLKQFNSSSGTNNPPIFVPVLFFGMFVAIGFGMFGIGLRCKTGFPVLFGSLFGGMPLLVSYMFLKNLWFYTLFPWAVLAFIQGLRMGARPKWRNAFKGGRSSSGGWTMGGSSSSGSSSSGSSSSGSSFGGGSSGGGGASGSW